MNTREDIIKQIKKENPTIQRGDDEQGYETLNAAEYEAMIELWADNQMAAELAQAEVEKKEEAKAALLNRLGITANEAKLLLS